MTVADTVVRSPAPARRKAALVAVVLECVVGASALGGGGAMLADPAGGVIGFDPTMLDRLPVDSWTLPGAALVLSNGVLPALVAAAELRSRQWPRRYGHALAGAVLLAWPVGETAIFGYPLEGEPLWLRPAVAGVGVALVALGLVLRRAEV